MQLSRRRLLRSTATLAGASSLALVPCAGWASSPRPSRQAPIVDAHIHLFDPTRPGGVVWPEPKDTVLYRPALPARYRSFAEDEGVVAAIAVECSPLTSDNQWLLNTARSNPIMVGVIGDLDPALQDFPAQLDQLRSDSLFRGIRYGNLWHRDLGAHLTDPRFLENLKLLAQNKLLLESANPDPKLVADLLRLANLLPDLRIVIDHLPQAVPPATAEVRASYLATLRQISRHPNVYVKGSEILRSINGAVPRDLAIYKPWLDTLWEMFGDDRIFFGSDWPNSDQFAPLPEVFKLAHSYLETHSPQAARKYFWQNSIRVYGWQARSEAQRRLLASLGT